MCGAVVGTEKAQALYRAELVQHTGTCVLDILESKQVLSLDIAKPLRRLGYGEEIELDISSKALAKSWVGANQTPKVSKECGELTYAALLSLTERIALIWLHLQRFLLNRNKASQTVGFVLFYRQEYY